MKTDQDAKCNVQTPLYPCQTCNTTDHRWGDRRCTSRHLVSSSDFQLFPSVWHSYMQLRTKWCRTVKVYSVKVRPSPAPHSSSTYWESSLAKCQTVNYESRISIFSSCWYIHKLPLFRRPQRLIKLRLNSGNDWIVPLDYQSFPSKFDRNSRRLYSRHYLHPMICLLHYFNVDYERGFFFIWQTCNTCSLIHCLIIFEVCVNLNVYVVRLTQKFIHLFFKWIPLILIVSECLSNSSISYLSVSISHLKFANSKSLSTRPIVTRVTRIVSSKNKIKK